MFYYLFAFVCLHCRPSTTSDCTASRGAPLLQLSFIPRHPIDSRLAVEEWAMLKQDDRETNRILFECDFEGS